MRRCTRGHTEEHMILGGEDVSHYEKRKKEKRSMRRRGGEGLEGKAGSEFTW